MITGSGESEAKISEALSGISIKGPILEGGQQLSLSLLDMIAPQYKINDADSKKVKQSKEIV